MAEQQSTLQRLNGAVIVTWEPLAAGDTGERYGPSADAAAIACVQMTGTFGGAVSIEGSNDGTNWVALKDMQGNQIALSSGDLVDFTTACRYIRPSAAAGVTAVTVTLIVRG